MPPDQQTLESRMQSLEQSIHAWTQESARDRSDLKDSIIELKDAVIALTRVQSKTEELEQDFKDSRLEWKDTGLKIATMDTRMTIMEEKIKTVDFIKKSAGVVFMVMLSMIIYLGWANLQMQDIHNKDLEIIQHIHVNPTPFKAVPTIPFFGGNG